MSIHCNPFSLINSSAAQYGDRKREAYINKAICRDLAYMHYILSEEQYHKYVMLLNLTLQNRGIK